MRRFIACVVSCLLVACGGSETRGDRSISTEVEAQLTMARDATIPAGVTLAQSSGPTHNGSVVSAEWSFEVEAGWIPYGRQATASLQSAGYDLVTKTDDALALARHIPGDAYRVRIRRDGATPAGVTVSFTASPD